MLEPTSVQLPHRPRDVGPTFRQAPEVIEIAAGGKHSLVLCANGSLYSFGFNGQGQLGQRSTDNLKRAALVEDFDGTRIQAISAGAHHSLV